jgi:hypothetical protein
MCQDLVEKAPHFFRGGRFSAAAKRHLCKQQHKKQKNQFAAAQPVAMAA